MDITFKASKGNFIFRVGAIILQNGKLLCMHRLGQSYYYVPGGRVKMYETAEAALKREIQEELNSDVIIMRPLWLMQSFYCKNQSSSYDHEICLYWLCSVQDNFQYKNCVSFVSTENSIQYEYVWVSEKEMDTFPLYPPFLKKACFNLPSELQLITQV